MSRVFSIFPSLLLSAAAFAQEVQQLPGKCFSNGVEVPCEQLLQAAGKIAGLGIGVFAAIAIVGLIGTIFWIMMLVHALSKQIENKVMWVVILIVFGFLGAIIYYFAVKRKFDKQMPAPSAPSQAPPTSMPPIQ